MGNFDEAESLALRVLSRPNADETATTVIGSMLMLLAGIEFLVRGNLTQAERLLKQALAVETKRLGLAGPHVLVIMGELGWLYHAQGRYAEAEGVLGTTLAQWERSSNPVPLAHAKTMKSLSKVFVARRQYHEAARLLEQAIVVLETHLGSDDYRMAYSLADLGHLYLKYLPDREDESEACFRRGLLLLERTVGLNHPDLVSCLDGLAECRLKRGQYAGARKLLCRSMRIVKKAYGTNHRDWAHCIWNVAHFYEVQGKYSKAERLCRQALAYLKRALGPDHPQVFVLLHNVAALCQHQGRLGEAETLFRQVLLNRQELFGPDHPQLEGTLRNYAALLHELGRDREASDMRARADMIRGRTEHDQPPKAYASR